MDLIEFTIDTISKMDSKDILTFFIILIIFCIGLTVYIRFLIKNRA